MVMTEALSDGHLDLEDAVRLLCFQPAKLFDLYPHKGVIQAGADADILLYDPAPGGKIDSSQWYSRSKVTDRLYNGRDYQGKVACTLVNGSVVYENGKIVVEKGSGQFVRPHRSR